MQDNTEKKQEKKVKGRDYILVAVMSALIFGISFVCWLKPEDSFSESERGEWKSWLKAQHSEN